MKSPDIILVAAILIGLSATFYLIIEKPLYVDETTHFYVISNFCRGNFTYPDFLTTIPGYHFFGSIFGYLANCSETSIRFFNLLVSGITVFVFFNIAKIVSPKASKGKTLLFILLPILFPFFFLVYTDMMSLLFVLLMFYFMLKGNYTLSALFGLLSFVVRQNNIIWVLFSIVYIGAAGNRFKAAIKKNLTPGFFKTVLPYIIVLVVASAFFMKTGGFSLGDKEKHPAFYLGFMNLYTALFFLFWINLPENLYNLKSLSQKIKKIKPSQMLLITSLAGAFFIFFLLTFKIDHPYNNYQIYSYFLRNKILHLFDSSIFLRSAFFACVLLAIASLYATKFKEKRQYLIYLFSGIFLASSWLIENRYFLIPFVFLNLFAARNQKTERCMIIWYLISSGIYMYLFYTGWTFW